MNDIIEEYKKQSGDDLHDLNEKQLEALARLAFENGHDYGISECVSFMWDYVSLARDILKFQIK